MDWMGSPPLTLSIPAPTASGAPVPWSNMMKMWCWSCINGLVSLGKSTLWLFNIAIEHGPFYKVFPFNMVIYVNVYQRVQETTISPWNMVLPWEKGKHMKNQSIQSHNGTPHQNDRLIQYWITIITGPRSVGVAKKMPLVKCWLNSKHNFLRICIKNKHLDVCAFIYVSIHLCLYIFANIHSNNQTGIHPYIYIYTHRLEHIRSTT